MTNSTPEIVRYHDGSAYRVAIVQAGRKLLHAIMLEDGPLRVRKLPAKEGRFMVPLAYHGAAYPLRRALVTFKRHGKAHGCTRTARRLLDALRGAR